MTLKQRSKVFARRLAEEWGGTIKEQLELIESDPHNIPIGEYDDFKMTADIMEMKVTVYYGEDIFNEDLDESDLEYYSIQAFYDWAWCDIITVTE